MAPDIESGVITVIDPRRRALNRIVSRRVQQWMDDLRENNETTIAMLEDKVLSVTRDLSILEIEDTKRSLPKAKWRYLIHYDIVCIVASIALFTVPIGQVLHKSKSSLFVQISSLVGFMIVSGLVFRGFYLFRHRWCPKLGNQIRKNAGGAFLLAFGAKFLSTALSASAAVVSAEFGAKIGYSHETFVTCFIILYASLLGILGLKMNMGLLAVDIVAAWLLNIIFTWKGDSKGLNGASSTCLVVLVYYLRSILIGFGVVGNFCNSHLSFKDFFSRFLNVRMVVDPLSAEDDHELQSQVVRAKKALSDSINHMKGKPAVVEGELIGSIRDAFDNAIAGAEESMKAVNRACEICEAAFNSGEKKICSSAADAAEYASNVVEFCLKSARSISNTPSSSPHHSSSSSPQQMEEETNVEQTRQEVVDSPMLNSTYTLVSDGMTLAEHPPVPTDTPGAGGLCSTSPDVPEKCQSNVDILDLVTPATPPHFDGTDEGDQVNKIGGSDESCLDREEPGIISDQTNNLSLAMVQQRDTVKHDILGSVHDSVDITTRQEKMAIMSVNELNGSLPALGSSSVSESQSTQLVLDGPRENQAKDNASCMLQTQVAQDEVEEKTNGERQAELATPIQEPDVSTVSVPVEQMRQEVFDSPVLNSTYTLVSDDMTLAEHPPVPTDTPGAGGLCSTSPDVPEKCQSNVEILDLVTPATPPHFDGTDEGDQANKTGGSDESCLDREEPGIISDQTNNLSFAMVQQRDTVKHDIIGSIHDSVDITTGQEKMAIMSVNELNGSLPALGSSSVSESQSNQLVLDGPRENQAKENASCMLQIQDAQDEVEEKTNGERQAELATPIQEPDVSTVSVPVEQTRLEVVDSPVLNSTYTLVSDDMTLAEHPPVPTVDTPGAGGLCSTSPDVPEKCQSNGGILDLVTPATPPHFDGTDEGDQANKTGGSDESCLDGEEPGIISDQTNNLSLAMVQQRDTVKHDSLGSIHDSVDITTGQEKMAIMSVNELNGSLPALGSSSVSESQSNQLVLDGPRENQAKDNASCMLQTQVAQDEVEEKTNGERQAELATPIQEPDVSTVSVPVEQAMEEVVDSPVLNSTYTLVSDDMTLAEHPPVPTDTPGAGGLCSTSPDVPEKCQSNGGILDLVTPATPPHFDGTDEGDQANKTGGSDESCLDGEEPGIISDQTNNLSFAMVQQRDTIRDI